LVGAIETFYTRACNLRPSAGLSQQVILNQQNATNITISGWSLGVNVSGVADSDYSLYVDVTYKDGDHTYGVYVSFPLNAGWNQQTINFSPKKRIDYLYVHLLFRTHTGAAYFDNISVKETQHLVYPLNTNILANPGFDASCTDISPWYTGANCVLVACATPYKSAPGALTVESGDLPSCFNTVAQSIYFSPPITNTLVFSAYVYINNTAPPGAVSYLSVGIFAPHNVDTQDIEFTDIDYAPTNGYVKLSVTLTPTAPIIAAEVSFIIQGPPHNIFWDNAKFIITNN
jgi:hypothetical protein